MHRAISNAELVELCKSGDQSAWSIFIERFSKLVFWAIKYKINTLRLDLSESDVEDIYQQAFLAIWQRRGLVLLKDINKIQRWLIIVAQNATADYIKVKRFSYDAGSNNQDSLTRISASSPIPSEKLEEEGLQKEIDSFIENLSLKEKRIMTMSLHYDFKYKDIARIMNMPAGTVGTLIKRIKDSLKDYLSSRGYEGV